MNGLNIGLKQMDLSEHSECFNHIKTKYQGGEADKTTLHHNESIKTVLLYAYAFMSM